MNGVFCPLRLFNCLFLSDNQWWVLCVLILLCIRPGGRQSGAILYSAFGAMGHTDATGKMGMSKSNGSMGSQTGSGYSTDVSDNNLPPDTQEPVSDEHSDSDQVNYWQFSESKEYTMSFAQFWALFGYVGMDSNCRFICFLLTFRMKGWSQMIWRRTSPSCPPHLTPAAWSWPFERSGSASPLPPTCALPHRPSLGTSPLPKRPKQSPS